ncbi:hypothetical protein F443_06843 [Phytophthora nicotianae P1569]|uniref:Uncharacterized protein n=1 Tax=Phytophthora nicotianae P1569 TaxID=1317065 RepID=V9FEM5_PHYNI|nr:hypothetical protein F443_06843 [Phytophthora nicotianae P1569]
MSSMTTLNQARKCMKDLDRFNESMGWTFRNLDDREDTGLYTPSDEKDTCRTAFGNVVEIPSDFVAPDIAASKTRTRHKSTSKPSQFYRKRATGLTPSSSAKTYPVDDQFVCDQQPPLQSKKRGHKTSSKPAKLQTMPVDYVYDINVRRKLREQVDADRRNNLLKAKAREAALRAENKWVFDKRDKSPPRRQQAWLSSSPGKQIPIKSISSSTRTESASSKRPSSSCSSRSTSTCHSQRHRTRVPYTDDTDDVEISIQDFERRLQTQWSLHVE